jgi:hypothetical protein
LVVRDLVAREARGQPTRAQLSAARRAANRYAASGRATIVRVPSDADNRAQVLTLVRTDAAPPFTTRHPRRGRARSDLVIARGLVRTVDRVVPAARLIDPARISPDEARTLAAALDDPIEELVRLRVWLTDRGHHH